MKQDYMKPDYTKLREDAGFSWYATVSYYLLAQLADVSLSELFKNVKASAKIYSKENLKKLEDGFSMFELLRKPVPSTPPISYGHLNTLGVPLVFPEGNGEVNYERGVHSLYEWLDILKENIDFSKSGLVPYYLQYQQDLKHLLKGERIAFSFVHEGPITTAYTMVDIDFYYDIFEQPEAIRQLLSMLSESITQYKRFYAKANDYTYSNMSTICDDCAAIISPNDWQEFVLPYWDHIYKDTGTGRRSLHCEGMDVNHLKHLETCSITFYDPSVSPKLNPQIIAANTRVPFWWRLCEINHYSMDRQKAMDFVFGAAAAGASGVFAMLTSLNSNDIEILEGFLTACTIVDEMKKKGANKSDFEKMLKR